MGRIGPQDTKPEMIVRRLLHSLGYRYRLHRRDLPGTPDIVFPSRRQVIFVHGCFWHRHPGCKAASTPKTRTTFWTDKFETNVARDRRTINELAAVGWRSEVIWSCQIKNIPQLTAKLETFLANHVVEM